MKVCNEGAMIRMQHCSKILQKARTYMHHTRIGAGTGVSHHRAERSQTLQHLPFAFCMLPIAQQGLKEMHNPLLSRAGAVFNCAH